MDKLTFPQLVKAELFRARQLHKDIKSRHEGYAVILEEIRELERETFKRLPDSNDLLGELIQVAAMCQRVAEDVLPWEVARD